jgi:hypothetical protein
VRAAFREHVTRRSDEITRHTHEFTHDCDRGHLQRDDDVCVALAKRLGAKVTVLTVLAPFHTFTRTRQLSTKRMQEHAEARHRRTRSANGARRMRLGPCRA